MSVIVKDQTDTTNTATDARIRALTKLGADGSRNEAASRSESGKVVFKAAEKSVEFFDHLRAHYRETRRTSVEIDCDLRLVLQDGTVFDSGTAVLKNLSPSGALLSGMKLKNGCLPAQAFKVVLVLKGDDYGGIGVEATPVRIVSEMAGLGVKFDEIFVSA